MIDLKTLKRAVDQIAEEKGVEPAKILEAIEASIAAAYRKEYAQKGEYIKCKFDLKTGELKFWQVKTVADETTVRIVEEAEENEEKEPTLEPRLPRYNPDRHLLLEEAKK